MLRLIIVDDEKIIRETIHHLINWNSLGVEVVGVCKNGLEAYDAIIDEYPDIVLTDIKMPGLSGLELIEKLKQTHEQIHFIILSGYEEFDYAKQAMRYGVRHYLLKPCNEHQIIAAVTETVKEIHSSKKDLSTTETLSADFEKIAFRNLLSECISSDMSLQQTKASYQCYLDFCHTTYTLYFVYYLEEHNLSQCKKIISQFMHTYYPGLLFHILYVKNTLLLLTQNNHTELNELQEMFPFLHFPDETVSISWEQKEFSCLEQCLFFIVPKLQRYDKLYYLDSEHDFSIYNHTHFILQAQNLCTKYYYEKQDCDFLKKELLEQFLLVQEMDFLITLVTDILLKQLQKAPISDTFAAIAIFKKISEAKTSEDVITLFINNFNLFFPTTYSVHYKPFIEKLLTYTADHLSDANLSLKWIANNYLYLNVDYVSKQFAKQTGEKFSNYLNRMRIEKAKQLLLECSTDKIYTVAEQVGCGKNPQYFSQLFKKYAKMTPTDYIKANSPSSKSNF